MSLIIDRPRQTTEPEGSIPDMAAIALPRTARTSALDRMLMRTSLALFLWARRRAVRRSLTHEEHAQRHELASGIAAREHEHELRWARLR